MRHNQFSQARLGTFCVFLVHGLVISTWASRIPAIQQKLGLQAGTFGLILLAGAIGTLLAMPVSGWLLRRWGSKPVVYLFSLLFCGLLPLLAFSASPFWLAVSLGLFGFSAGAMDVSMNAQAVHIEKAYEKPIMVTFHALFSLGGMLGAVLGGFIAALKVTPFFHFMATGLVYALIITVADRLLVDDHVPDTEKSALFSAFSLPLAGLCLIGFCCFLSEGAILDWSEVFLFKNLHSGETLAPLGYGLFSIAMALGRLVGDGLTQRFGASRLVSIGSLIAAAGMTLALFGNQLWFSIVGFTIVGIGFSTIVPLVFSRAGMNGANSNASLTTVTMFSYTAFLLGPPLIGFMAQGFGLQFALSLIIALALVSAGVGRLCFTGDS